MRSKAFAFQTTLFLLLSFIISYCLAVDPAAGIHGYAWNPRNVEDAAVWRSASDIDWGTSSQWTFEAWYQNTGQDNTYESIWTSIDPNSRYVLGAFVTGGNDLSIFNGEPWSDPTGTSTSMPPLPSSLTHLAWVYSGNSVATYVDGAFVGNVTTPYTWTNGSPDAGRLNLSGFAQAEPIRNGVLDEFRVWSRALTQEEIAETMFAVLDSSTPNLNAYFRWSECGQGTSTVPNEGGGGSGWDLSPDSSAGPLDNTRVDCVQPTRADGKAIPYTDPTVIPSYLTNGSLPLVGYDKERGTGVEFRIMAISNPNVTAYTPAGDLITPSVTDFYSGASVVVEHAGWLENNITVTLEYQVKDPVDDGTSPSVDVFFTIAASTGPRPNVTDPGDVDGSVDESADEDEDDSDSDSGTEEAGDDGSGDTPSAEQVLDLLVGLATDYPLYAGGACVGLFGLVCLSRRKPRGVDEKRSKDIEAAEAAEKEPIANSAGPAGQAKSHRRIPSSTNSKSSSGKGGSDKGSSGRGGSDKSSSQGGSSKGGTGPSRGRSNSKSRPRGNSTAKPSAKAGNAPRPAKPFVKPANDFIPGDRPTIVPPRLGGDPQKLEAFKKLIIEAPEILAIAGKLVPDKSVEDVARAHIRTMEGIGQIHTMLIGILDYHLNEGEPKTAATALPPQAYVTKVLTLYFRLCGIGYVRSTLGPLVRELAEVYPEDTDLTEEQEVDAVKTICRKVVQAISDSPCPAKVQEVIACLRNSLRKARLFKNASALIGQALLTRFMLPGLVTPKTMGLVKAQLPPLLASLLQSATQLISFLAVRSSMTTSTPPLEWMNDYSDLLDELERPLTSFLSGVGSSKPPPVGQPSPNKPLSSARLAQEGLEHTWFTCYGRAALIQAELRGTTEEAWAALTGQQASSAAQDTLDSLTELTDNTDMFSDMVSIVSIETLATSATAKTLRSNATNRTNRSQGTNRSTRRGSRSRP